MPYTNVRRLARGQFVDSARTLPEPLSFDRIPSSSDTWVHISGVRRGI
jgi:hypothetical protein